MLSEQQAGSIPDIRVLTSQDGGGQDALYAATADRAPVAGYPRLYWAGRLPPLVLCVLQSTLNAAHICAWYYESHNAAAGSWAINIAL